MRRLIAAAVAVTLAAVFGGCGSSGGSTKAGTGSPTINVGLITDLTGPAASSGKTSVFGVQAGIDALAAPAGFKLHVINADTETNPSQGLNAARLLVEQDHVSVVLGVSALFFASAGYLTQHNIPVIGVAEDGPEWRTSPNMYSVYGAVDTTAVSDGGGRLFKKLGATTIGSVGYSISPSSAEAAKASAASARYAGLRVGYLNASFPFGSTNVEPEAIAMKQAGVDGLTASVDPNTGFALINALRQLGDNPKVAILPTGYGGDLAQAGPGALQSAQGVYFGLEFEPMEMNTAATKKFASGLSRAGVTGDPTYGEYAGYTSVALLVDALQKAGGNYSAAGIMAALNKVTGYNAAGLLGSHSFSPAARLSTPIGVDGCSYYTRLSGSTFQLVPGADPFCGSLIPGLHVSASS